MERHYTDGTEPSILPHYTDGTEMMILPHYTDGTESTILPHLSTCIGPCEQGRRPCPLPDACMLPEQEDSPPLDRTGLFLLVLSILAGWVAVLGLVHAARWAWGLIFGG